VTTVAGMERPSQLHPGLGRCDAGDFVGRWRVSSGQGHAQGFAGNY